MALKRIDESPTITDTIIFDILTPDANGCYLSNPYKISQITIYYITRDFSPNNTASFTALSSTDSGLLSQYEAAKAAACLSPTPANIATVERLYNQLEASMQSDTYYYKDALPIAVFGTSTFPVWLETSDPILDAANAATWHVTLIDEDDTGATQYGHFELQWSPVGQREGDYIICWTWTSLAGGDSLSDYRHFSLSGDTQVTTSIPTHFTKQSKYETLLNRYLPDVFKAYWASDDLSPEVLQEFNNSIAQMFILLEDLTNQSVDLLDSNAIHESFLVYLGNLFNLKLRSHDPTLWRRQIKRAIPVFKKKGTLRGLVEALAQAGIELRKFTKLWQVVSPYTWQELFDITEVGQRDFTLSKVMILPADINNFELYYRGADDDSWTPLTIDYVHASNYGGETIITWVGDMLSVNPIQLSVGDSIRIIYQVNDITPVEQPIEDHIRSLPLADQRDERDQTCPVKNWNVRVMDEDDSFFDIIIPTRHPYVDPLIFGWIRTEFPYSENIYNADEYDGSSRESRSPCDIECDFFDPCTACQGSKYVVDLRIEQLSDDRIRESLEILDEYTPFHAVLHQINFEGLVNEFVEPPVEEIEMLVRFATDDFAISGNAQMFFNRVTENGLHSIRRDSLAIANLVVGTLFIWFPVVGYNEGIMLFAPDVKLDTLGWDDLNTGNNVLEILSGKHKTHSPYTCSSPDGNTALVHGIPVGDEPLSSSSFNFRLSLNLYSNPNINITQEFEFDDPSVDIAALWDVNNPREVYDGTWVIEIPAYPYPGPSSTYTIVSITPTGKILINGYAHPLNTLPTVNTVGISYTVRNSTGYLITSGTTGRWTKTNRAVVDFSSELTLTDVRNLFDIGQYVYYSTVQYPIVAFIHDDLHRLIIGNYDQGSASGIFVAVYKRLADNQVGYLQYKNMVIDTAPANFETILGILNGVNAPVDPNLILDSDLWKESFLVVVQNLVPIPDDNYAISQIDGTKITLSGPHRDWKTLAAGGENLLIHIWQYVKQPLTIPEREYPPMPEHTFNFVDRRGNEVFDITTETATPFLAMPMMMSALTNAPGNEISEVLGANESVSFSIEYKD